MHRSTDLGSGPNILWASSTQQISYVTSCILTLRWHISEMPLYRCYLMMGRYVECINYYTLSIIVSMSVILIPHQVIIESRLRSFLLECLVEILALLAHIACMSLGALFFTLVFERRVGIDWVCDVSIY